MAAADEINLMKDSPLIKSLATQVTMVAKAATDMNMECVPGKLIRSAILVTTPFGSASHEGIQGSGTIKRFGVDTSSSRSCAKSIQSPTPTRQVQSFLI